MTVFTGQLHDSGRRGRVTRRFWMLDRGTMENIMGNETIDVLRRGSAEGIGWLIEATLPKGSKKHPSIPCAL
eukprot:scaffold8911_cov166-Amphora_coffeaeformis.AAC.1